MIHLPCTNEDTRDEPECQDGHDWPDIGDIVTLKKRDGHRAVGSELTITFHVDTVQVEAIDTDIHCVMVNDPGAFVRVWVDLDDIIIKEDA